MEKNQAKKSKSFTGIKSSGLVMLACFALALIIYKFVLGNPANFLNGDPNNHPLEGNFLGLIYKGGIIVPIIQTLLLTVIALSVERFFAIKTAQGKGKLATFVKELKTFWL